MTVRAKFKVQSVTETKSSSSGRQAGRSSWERSTRISGLPLVTGLRLAVFRPPSDYAAAQFVPGRQFYVDFTPADEQPAP